MKGGVTSEGNCALIRVPKDVLSIAVAYNCNVDPSDATGVKTTTALLQISDAITTRGRGRATIRSWISGSSRSSEP